MSVAYFNGNVRGDFPASTRAFAGYCSDHPECGCAAAGISSCAIELKAKDDAEQERKGNLPVHRRINGKNRRERRLRAKILLKNGYR